MCLDSIVSPLRLRWVKGCVNDRDLLRAIAITRGVERIRNKSTESVEEKKEEKKKRKKVLQPILPGLEFATFRSTSMALLCN